MLDVLRPVTGQTVAYRGQRAEVLDPNFAGKGTVQVRFEDGSTKVIHSWEIKPAKPVENTTARDRMVQEERLKVGNPDPKADAPGLMPITVADLGGIIKEATEAGLGKLAKEKPAPEGGGHSGP